MQFLFAGIRDLEKNNNEEYFLRRELNIRKVVIVSGVCLIISLLILIASLYIAEKDFRNWTDIHVLRKSITNKDVSIIDLDADKNNQVFCYYKYICILNDKLLSLYTQNGEKTTEIPVDVNTALFSTEDKYLAIAEKNGGTFCLIQDKTYLWRQEIDGKILQMNINKNGYVVIVTTDTTYKSIITLYNQEGKQLFKNYLSSTRVEDIVISNDNKYVAYAELDTSGALIQSNIKIISVQNAMDISKDATIYEYKSEISKLIIKLKYQEKGDLIALYDDEIVKININNTESMEKIGNDVSFASINLKNKIAFVREESIGVFNSNSELIIKNVQNGQVNSFEFNEVVKEMYTNGNVIGVNIGTEMYFINASGMLIKNYKNNQEITNVLISEELAIIVYKDRIEIIKL